MAELDVGAAGHHLPQVSQPRICTHALRGSGQAKPDPTALLQKAGQRYIVDAGSTDPIEPAGGFERRPSHEHAASCRGRSSAGTVDAGERVELGKEVDEGRS